MVRGEHEVIDLKIKQAFFAKLLLESNYMEISEWVIQEITQGTDVLDFFNKIFTPSMATIGNMFGKLEIFLPELIDAAEKAKMISEQILQPSLLKSNIGYNTIRGKVVICSVKGDLHDIGKNMVKLMLQVNGFEVIDLGIDVEPRDVIHEAKDVCADIIGLSSLMTTSMPYMKETIELRDGFGMKDKVKVIVGGAPITPEYSQQIGADAFGRDAMEGVQKCLELIGGEIKSNQN
jgi:methylmalonyl-CoA mutase cobalamin-binding domain/chain